MKRSKPRRHRRSGFTLLELVIVLAILALVTTLAFRSLDDVEDQRRYEVSRAMLASLEKAVLGDEETTGFVADMGRLPRTTLVGSELTLAELWSQSALPAYDVRSTTIDPEVLLPSGWRGPYLTLPIDADNLRDGWGNEMISLPTATPSNPMTTGYHRLRDANDAAIIAAGQPVSIVRHLGGDSAVGGGGADSDLHILFASTTPAQNRYAAQVKATVTVLNNDGSPAGASSTDFVYVRVFAPDPSDASQLVVVSGKTAQTQTVNVPAASGSTLSDLTIGPRAVRAYVIQDQGNADPSDDVLIAKSAIKHLTLRPGVNFIPLTIYRP